MKFGGLSGAKDVPNTLDEQRAYYFCCCRRLQECDFEGELSSLQRLISKAYQQLA
ncbi:hypothetical protein QQ045_006775 [Rhodiola kirilowii]